MTKHLITIVALLILTFAPAQTPAAPIQGGGSSSLEGLGSFTGDISYNYNPGDLFASLTIGLTNTSPAANEGYIGSFAFFLPDPNSMFISSFASSNPYFELLYNPSQGVMAPPFTTPGYEPGTNYHAGATIGANWTGLGKPDMGIGAGETAMFTFGISGYDLGSFITADFMVHANFMAVRFAGFADGGSDKVAAYPGGTAPVPEPGTFLLLGCGLLGIAWLRRGARKPLGLRLSLLPVPPPIRMGNA